MKSLGMSGTRNGLSDKQKIIARKWFQSCYDNGYREFHHGDCVGSDAECAKIAKEIGYRIIAHPPTNPALRAFFEGNDVILPEKTYMKRNRDIVNSVNSMLFFPKQSHEPKELKGGTWQTYKYADSINKSLQIIYA